MTKQRGGNKCESSRGGLSDTCAHWLQWAFLRPHPRSGLSAWGWTSWAKPGTKHRPPPQTQEKKNEKQNYNNPRLLLLVLLLLSWSIHYYYYYYYYYWYSSKLLYHAYDHCLYLLPWLVSEPFFMFGWHWTREPLGCLAHSPLHYRRLEGFCSAVVLCVCAYFVSAVIFK